MGYVKIYAIVISEIGSKILVNRSKPQQTSPNRLRQTDSNKKKQSQRSPLPPITTSPARSSSSARAINLSKTRSRLRAREPGRGERVEWEKERARVPSNDSASRHVSRYASYGNVSAGSRPNGEKKRLRSKSKVACLTKVEQGRASRRTTRAKTDQEDERRGARGKREKCITSAARTDVIFIPGPGRGQRGHQRTGDE